MKNFDPNRNLTLARRYKRINEARQSARPAQRFMSDDDFEDIFAAQDKEKEKENKKAENRRIENTMAAINTLLVGKKIPFYLFDSEKKRYEIRDYQTLIANISRIFTNMFVRKKGDIILAIVLSSAPDFETKPVYNTKEYLKKWPFSFQRSQARKQMEEMAKYVRVEKMRNGQVILQILMDDQPGIDYPFMIAFAQGVYLNKKTDYELDKNFIR